MAVFPTAPSHPDYSSNGSIRAIPAIYSKLLVRKYYAATLLNEISNTNYEGEIKAFGDTVFMRTRPTIDTFNYQKGMVLPVQNPESPYVELKIDKGKGFSFAIDRVDEFQSNIPLMKEWAADSAEQMKIVVDRDVLSTIYADAHARNTGANAGVISQNLNLGAAGAPLVVNELGAGAKTGADAANALPIIDAILRCGQVLDEQNITESNRWIILPAWAIRQLKGSDLKAAYLTGDATSPLRNGKVGMVDRFTVYASNLLAPGADAGSMHCIFGHSEGFTFATQITESRIIDNPFSFGKLMQGLQVYGYKVSNPEAIGHLLIKSA